ncbi:MAG TPA: phage holin family protein [Thermoanaerobaculia bacterium]|nr:phage holin family protein [Thermoanaerobaculia bacterium]
MRILLSWLLNALALWIVTLIVPAVGYESVVSLVIAAAVLGIVNAIVRPILFWLTLPLTIVTLGLFLIVLNALMLELTAWLVPGFRVDGFGWAMLAALILGLISLVTNRIDEVPKRRD